MTVRSSGRSLLMRHFDVVLVAGLAATLSGCGTEPAEGGKERARTTASGSVTFDGQPIPAGSVTFRHADSGNYAACPIDDGDYESVSGEGPLVGKNTVTVVGIDGPNGKPLWGGEWSREVDVTDAGFEQNFEIKKADVPAYNAPPPSKKEGEGDEETPLYEQ